MSKRMLIDATHAEETRVTVVSGNRLEEFDYETTTKQQIKGNIYLAKVTRVEPSLQAAFVEYGGNRHGFLAFSEIHPDYYRIPVSDREELVDDEDGDDDENGDGEADVEDVSAGGGVDEAVEEAAKRRPRLRRQYKIQEVVKRRQVMLVQVVKEERGTKGAALTTYLSLAGRYCVVMPNTSRGGGVSRKIANAQDRKRLKSILSELSVPDGMAVILRTAGAERSKAEVKRDFDYLMRLWDDIREKTLESTAPSLIHEEGNLVKRAIRDVYSKDIEEVLVAGEDGYRIAKDFMKSLIPSHAKKVQPYKDEQGIPLFHRYQVEQQLAQIHDATVQLRSGGSIVIHQTEALVAIDVNSGKATRERHIEETALKTNLEAAEEVARQLRLRDLAGLIVIDFIDMDENRNDHAVERRLKEALRRDRARIQVGRISGFGLLEMSRQRLRPSLIEAMSQPCPTCGGVGYIVSTESAALMVTRAIEEEGLRKRAAELTVRLPGSVALYVLNHKRAVLTDMEERYGFTVTIEAVDGMLPPQFDIQRAGAQDQDDSGEAVTTAPKAESDGEERGSRRRRSRGGRRRGRRDEEADTGQDVAQASEADEEANDNTDGEDGEERGRRRRKRGRRGGRRRGRGRGDGEVAATEEGDSLPQDDGREGDADQSGADQSGSDQSGPDQVDSAQTADTADPSPAPKRRRSRKRRTEAANADTPDAVREEQPAASEEDASQGASTEDVAADATDTEAEEKPKKPRRSRKKAAAAKPEPAAPEAESTDGGTEEEKPKKPRRARKKAAAAKPEPASPEPAAPVENAQEPVSEAVSEPVEAPAPTVAAQPEVPSEPANNGGAPLPEPVSEETGPAASEPEVKAEPPRPKRKGWWNRVIG